VRKAAATTLAHDQKAVRVVTMYHRQQSIFGQGQPFKRKMQCPFLGHKQTFRGAKRHVRFTPESGHQSR
jgi:hypothetical protein